jgi:hypothetical protein
VGLGLGLGVGLGLGLGLGVRVVVRLFSVFASAAGASLFRAASSE